MGWKLLKKRRWEGPYSFEDLQKMFKEGKISPADYLLDENNNEKFPTQYKTVSQILKLNPQDAVAPTVLKVIQKKEEQFTQFEREEITKVIEEQVEPTDLFRKNKDDIGDSQNTRAETIPSGAEGFLSRIKELPWFRYANICIFIALSMGLTYGIKKIFLSGQIQKAEESGLTQDNASVPPESHVNPASIRKPASEPPSITLPSRPEPERAPNSSNAPFAQDPVENNSPPDRPDDNYGNDDRGINEDDNGENVVDSGSERDPDSPESDYEEDVPEKPRKGKSSKDRGELDRATDDEPMEDEENVD